MAGKKTGYVEVRGQRALLREYKWLIYCLSVQPRLPLAPPRPAAPHYDPPRPATPHWNTGRCRAEQCEDFPSYSTPPATRYGATAGWEPRAIWGRTHRVQHRPHELENSST